MGQAALARRKNQSKRLYVAGPRGFGLCLVFPAEILSFLRGQAYQVLLIRASRAALQAYPLLQDTSKRASAGHRESVEHARSVRFWSCTPVRKFICQRLTVVKSLFPFYSLKVHTGLAS